MRKLNNRKNLWLSGPYLVWIVGFIVLPLLTIVYYALTDRSNSFTLDNIIAAVKDTDNLKALGLTLLLATLATLICLLLAYPLAVCLTKLRLRQKDLIVYLFILPIFMNFMLQMVSINVIISQNGVLNSFLSAIGLPKLNIANSFWAILIGMSYDYFPFMLLPLFNTVSRINQDYINAAGDLGANSFKTFTRITFPLSLPGVISGITMVFIPAISDFAIAEMLGGGKALLIGNIIEQNFTKGQYNTGSGLALLLMIFVLVSSLIPTGDKEEEEGGGIIL